MAVRIEAEKELSSIPRDFCSIGDRRQTDSNMEVLAEGCFGLIEWLYPPSAPKKKRIPSYKHVTHTFADIHYFLSSQS